MPSEETAVTAHIKITKRKVDQLKADGADTFYWDDDLPGFGVRVRGSGRKYYVVQYRADGRVRRITLGRHGAVSTETARRRAMAAISEAKGGGDPAAARDERRKAVTMKQLGKRFLEEYVPNHCKPSTAYEYGRSVKFFIDPRIGRRKVRDIKRSDIAELHHELRDTPLPSQPDAGSAVQDIQPSRGVGASSGRFQSVHARQALQGGKARAVPQRRGVFAVGTGAGRDPARQLGDPLGGSGVPALDADRVPSLGDPEATVGARRSRRGRVTPAGRENRRDGRCHWRPRPCGYSNLCPATRTTPG